MKLQGRALQQIAAAYALGTLSPRGSRRFESMLARDIELRRAWQQWEERLAAFTPDIPTVRPPDGAWAAIERQIERKSSAPRGQRTVWLLAAAVVVGVTFFLVWRKVRP